MATLYILYGSATGNAEYIAKDLAAKGPPAPFENVVCDPLEKYKKYSDAWSKPPTADSKQKKHGLLVICSTTGNGDAPENASRFVRYIKRKTTIDACAMKYINYAVLGLGDTNYDIFCGAAKSIDKKLEECGGTRIQSISCADEATGLEDVVEPWTDTVLQTITKTCFSDDNTEEEKENNENDPGSPNPAIETEPATPEDKAATTEEPAAAATTTTTTSKETKKNNFNKVLDKTLTSDSPLFILYGSATGNAEQIAKDLAATYTSFLSNPDAFTYFPSVVCCDLNGWRKQCLPTWEKEISASSAGVGAKHGVIIVTSTTGNSDPPENSERFVRWLKRKQTATAMPFQNVAYSVLGLGDTNYDVFCANGKAIDKKLSELGGTRVKELACADEATGLEDVVDPWVATVLLEMSLACQGKSSSSSAAAAAAEAGPATTTKTTKALEKDIIQDRSVASSDGEEKKMDVGDVVAPSTATASISTNQQPSSSGVRTICSILNLDHTCPMQEVDRTCLPKIGTSLSSCQLLTQLEQEEEEQRASADDDRLTVSSASSSAIHYTLKKPFESSILNARYLTATSTEAAQRAADILSGWSEQGDKNDDNTINASLIQQAMDVYTEHFPLLVSDTNSKESTEKNGKRVIELTLALPDDFTLEYSPGDSLGLIVQNTPEAVEFVLHMLRENHGILRDQHVSIDNGNPITVSDAISREIDLCSPLKSKRILFSLSQHATNVEDRKALQLLASKTPTGEKAFEEFVEKQRLSVVDLLHEFPSCQCISLTALLSILPGIPPRYYSVSSSPLAQKQDLSLTVSFSVVDYVTPSLMSADGQERGLRRKKGIATRYLEVLASPFLVNSSNDGASTTAITLPTNVNIFPKPTAEFRMPNSLSTPMILIGPGTGIAPFMGFLQHRRAMLSSMESKDAATSVVEGTWRGGYEMEEDELHISKGDASGLSIGADFISKNLENNVGTVDVFFGCRHKDHDWLYENDMKELQEQGIISKLYTTFSRDPKTTANGNQCKYVQHVMVGDTECASRLQSLILEKNATIFVCGDGNAMAKDVQSAFTEIIDKKLGQGEEAAKEYVEKMKHENRYLVDIWS